jgi:hypothetical protein
MIRSAVAARGKLRVDLLNTGFPCRSPSGARTSAKSVLDPPLQQVLGAVEVPALHGRRGQSDPAGPEFVPRNLRPSFGAARYVLPVRTACSSPAQEIWSARNLRRAGRRGRRATDSPPECERRSQGDRR